MRSDLETLMKAILKSVEDANMAEAAKSMGVSKATAYRYKDNPMKMPVQAFLALSKHLSIPFELNLTMFQGELVDHERLRLKLEHETAAVSGTRIVTTPVFTVNCELPEFTKARFESRYPQKRWHMEDEYSSLRSKRRDLYLSGHYDSTEIIDAGGYIDFFLGRNAFAKIDPDVLKKQHQAILETNELPHVSRYIYKRATPRLPVILCYSTGETILRVDDIVINLAADHYKKAKRTLRRYRDNCDLHSPEDVRAFLENPTA